jgi:phytol kinase
VTALAAPARAATRTEVVRKALHLLTASVPVAWGLGWAEPDRVRSGLLVLAAVAILAETARALIPAVRRGIVVLAGALFRTHEHRAVLGATWLALAMALAAHLFPPAAAIAALWAVAVGDAAAALVGRATTASGGKTLAGSSACALTTAIGAWWLAGAAPLAAALIGFAAALAERPRLAIDDNLRVAAAAGLAAWALGVA